MSAKSSASAVMFLSFLLLFALATASNSPTLALSKGIGCPIDTSKLRSCDDLLSSLQKLANREKGNTLSKSCRFLAKELLSLQCLEAAACIYYALDQPSCFELAVGIGTVAYANATIGNSIDAGEHVSSTIP